MKLFNAIATAAVIGTSFIAPNPAEARNGWMSAGTTGYPKVTYYVKPLDNSGRYRRYLGKASHVSGTFNEVADCHLWRTRMENSSEWRDAMPGSVGEAQIEIVCR